MPALADLPVPATPEVAPEAPVEAAPAQQAPALPAPFDSIVAGKLPGLQVPPIHKNDGVPDELQTFVVHNLHNLLQAGLDYHDLPNHTTVLFNPDVVTQDQIAQGYKDGNLDKIVPTAKAFSEFLEKQTAAAPAPAPGAGLADAPPPVPAPSAGPVEGPAGSTPPGVARARLANVTPPKGVVPNPVPNQLSKRAI